MEWLRGEGIGHGSFATISKAQPRNPSSQFPPIMAVKSSEASSSTSLQHEQSVLQKLGACKNIIRCFGSQTTIENNRHLFNLFLELASNGSLADRLRIAGGKLPEPEIRRHARSVLNALAFVHARGFVHCDVKLANVLVFADGEAKLADFGLAKAAGESVGRHVLLGTPFYLAPESVNDGEYEAACDVWALGCLVAEMAMGRRVWDHAPGESVWPLLMRIGGSEAPVISGEVSDLAQDFLRKCLVKNQAERWTAEMLLNHPFVASEAGEFHDEASPRCPFEFSEWVTETDSDSELGLDSEFSMRCDDSPAKRVRELVAAGNQWSESDSWVTVRE